MHDDAHVAMTQKEKEQTILIMGIFFPGRYNVLDEGLRIGGIGRRMNSKVKSVKQGVYRK
jgi:hypothetical protein